MRSKNDRKFIRKKIATFKEAIAKLAALLAGKNVRVVFRGSECKTDGHTIYLPALGILESSEATDEEILRFIESFIGYVEHEVGHVLFTDMGMYRRHAKKHLPQVTALVNAIEDAFVERKMSEMLRGAGLSLERMTNFVFEDNREKYKDMPAFGQICMLVCYLAKGHAFRHVTKYFDPDIVRWVDQYLDDEIAAASDISHTRQSLKLGRTIFEKVKAAFAEPPKEQEPEGGGQDQGQEQGEEEEGQPQGQSQSQQQQGEGEDDEDGEEGDHGDSAERGEGEDDEQEDGHFGEGDESEEDDSGDGEDSTGDEEGSDDEESRGSDDEGGDSDDADEDDDDAGDDGDDAGSSGLEEEDDEGGSSGGKESESDDDTEEDGDGWSGSGDTEEEEEEDDEGQGQLSDKDDSGIEDDDFEDPTRVGDSMRDSFKDLYRHAPTDNSGAYTPYTTEGDDVGPMALDSSYRMYRLHAALESIEQQALEVVGPLKSALSRVLRARGSAYQLRDLEYGKLDRRRLWKSAMASADYTPRVYKDTVQEEVFNLSVLLAVNESGSMGAFRRMRLAQQSALVLGDVMHSLGIPFGIFGHTTGDHTIGHERYRDADKEDRERFTRFGDLRIEWVKEFSDQWMRQRHLVAGLQAQQNTYDSEAVSYGAKILASQKHVNRRILLMVDDGQPFPNVSNLMYRHQQELKDVVEEVTEAGIEVVGIGMGDNSVTMYYPDYVVVEDITKLPEVMLTKFGELLGVNRKRTA